MYKRGDIVEIIKACGNFPEGMIGEFCVMDIPNKNEIPDVYVKVIGKSYQGEIMSVMNIRPVRCDCGYTVCYNCKTYRGN